MKSLLLVLVTAICCSAQSYDHFTSVRKRFESLTNTDDASRLWHSFIQEEAVPFAVHDSVLFFYKGEAKTVSWMGDFNGWGYNKNFNNKGKRIAGTDIWILKTSFPSDA